MKKMYLQNSKFKTNLDFLTKILTNVDLKDRKFDLKPKL